MERLLTAIAGAAALVGVAGVRAAAVVLLMVVVGAAGVGVKDQRAGKISRRSADDLKWLPLRSSHNQRKNYL